MEGSDEAEYGLFERFFHKDSFIAEETEGTESGQQDESAGIYKCRLDRDRDQSEKVLDEKVKAPFLAQVDEVLQYICNGFIFDTQKSGEEYTEEERGDIFESAVKLIYRCLFLFYAEARRLLPSDPDKADLYRRHSIQALCEEARKFRWGERRDTDQYDLWKHLKGLINAVNEGDPEYGILGYNGGLFDDDEERFLGQYQLRNDFLSRALYLLAFVEPYDNEPDEEYAVAADARQRDGTMDLNARPYQHQEKKDACLVARDAVGRVGHRRSSCRHATRGIHGPTAPGKAMPTAGFRSPSRANVGCGLSSLHPCDLERRWRPGLRRPAGRGSRSAVRA